MQQRFLLLPLIGALALMMGAFAKDSSELEKGALIKLQPLVGQWRGVGQLRRGSNRGAWVEKSEWKWRFSEDGAALRFDSTQSKYFTSGELNFAAEEGQYTLQVTLVEAEDPVLYFGELNESQVLILRADSASSAVPARISIRWVAGGDRLLVLLEKRAAQGDRFFRLAEIGYTRKGSQFGKGTSFVECVVTGGKGTIPVMHEGATYYVCCSGCRDLFNEDPAGVLAEYREKKEREKTQDR